ncbi:MAG: hypothetical protein DME16_10650 [Candidatus Rokuibacteriota bacterium]|nr:MAG: hypothetical protein DME16_10650 [Candidatus Rokubacteria bacterium]
MPENTLKQQLYAGKAAFGVMCTFPSPPVVEMLGHLGFDWILLDNEHGSITVDTAEACIVAAELTGMAPIVRPVGNKAEIIAPFLDRGAWGVQVPHVNTADEARAAVDAVKYGPEGHRGIFSGGRPAGYGFKGATADYAREANRQTLVCLMLEEVEAIENLPDLVTVPGVDVYFIGSGDLSQSMGHTGQPTHPDVQQVMERGIKTITGAGRIAGCSCPDNMARIPLVTRDQIVEKEKAAYDAFMLSRANRPNIGPYSLLLHMPEMAQRLEALRTYLRDEASLPQKLQELVMISVAREMGCAFIWYAHAAAARQAGVRGDIVDGIREKHALANLDPEEQTVVDFTRELLQDRKVSRPTFDAATARFGQRGTMTLTNLIACYAVLAYNMNTYALEAPAHPTEPALP